MDDEAKAYFASDMPLKVQMKLVEGATGESTREVIAESIKERGFEQIKVIRALDRDTVAVLAEDAVKEPFLSPLPRLYSAKFSGDGRTEEKQFTKLPNAFSAIHSMLGIFAAGTGFGFVASVHPEIENLYSLLPAFVFGGAGLYGALDSLRPFAFRRRRQTREWEQELSNYRLANFKDLEKEVESISVYQGSMEEISNELHRELERVDIDHSAKYLHSDDPYWLRAEAWALGADAVVHYQPGSATGTPVRFVDS